MRKALEFPRIDEGKLDAVEALIAAIAVSTLFWGIAVRNGCLFFRTGNTVRWIFHNQTP